MAYRFYTHLKKGNIVHCAVSTKSTNMNSVINAATWKEPGRCAHLVND